MEKAIFVDKDGTLIENVPFNAKTEVIKFLPGVFEGLKKLQNAGYKLIVVSNQVGIARGIFTEENFREVIRFMKKELKKHGITLDGFYYCPHDLNGTIEQYTKKCNCHKPLPGMILQAAKELHIDLTSSWMIGDTPRNDIVSGNWAGVKTILIKTENEDQVIDSAEKTPTVIVKNFTDAVNVILDNDYQQPFKGVQL